MDDEWDLHAVVRSYTTISTDATTAASGTNTTTSDDGFDMVETVASGNEIYQFSYSNTGENQSEGLEEVYKEGCSQRLGTTATAVVSGDDEQLPVFDGSCDSFSNETPSRKRKNQQKKVVVELTQEELCSDTWAWRKYGQKPIKGSPFPRNYYKCSTTKACGARKQVEQSHVDPTVFIVSYSGEHMHPRPTHRSPLAGSTRSNKSTMAHLPPPISDDCP
ncbi:probable WRKY transcription factor 27 isoform X1 [Lactuca sativa]|uniref:probable WRKY transcription factor 27 isoform X1 n=1 Tax=Lactuca sativa TaxID=4236 RepID=UPI000CD883A0|nr:probable WRKY transcription factor 27 isoform X1 [Lactuca sativa]